MSPPRVASLVVVGRNHHAVVFTQYRRIHAHCTSSPGRHASSRLACVVCLTCAVIANHYSRRSRRSLRPPPFITFSPSPLSSPRIQPSASASARRQPIRAAAAAAPGGICRSRMPAVPAMPTAGLHHRRGGCGNCGRRARRRGRARNTRSCRRIEEVLVSLFRLFLSAHACAHTCGDLENEWGWGGRGDRRKKLGALFDSCWIRQEGRRGRALLLTGRRCRHSIPSRRGCSTYRAARARRSAAARRRSATGTDRTRPGSETPSCPSGTRWATSSRSSR